MTAAHNYHEVYSPELAEAQRDALLTNSGQATILMPDGREDTVLITSTRMDSEFLLARPELTGSGEPPF